MSLIPTALFIAFAYLLGSIPVGLLLSQLYGVDIRRVGSGNIGATNVFRSVGKAPGIATFVGDALKGFVPAYVFPILWKLLTGTFPGSEIGLLCGCAAIVGHNWPLFLRFQGGKGIATSAGVLLGIAPAAAGIGLLGWIFLFITSRYVSIASIGAAIMAPAVSWILYSEKGLLLPIVLTILGLIAVWRHKPNIQRLIDGTEHRFHFRGKPETDHSKLGTGNMELETPGGAKRIGILGDGGWGTALAVVLHHNGHAVCVWGPFPDLIEEVRRCRENEKFLPGFPLPPEIRWTADKAEAVAEADVVILAMPSRFFRSVLESFVGLIPSSAWVLSVTKGLDEKTGKRMTETAEEILTRKPVAALSGPSLAAEVARGIPTAVTIACEDPSQALSFQRLLMNPSFRVYTSDDVIGVELGGALKNVIAIAAGVCDGIRFGENTKAALITRGLAEITRLGCALGAHPATFAGLSGMGDLVVTCASRLSRNHTVGERMGRGEPIDQILKTMEQVAEGVWTCAIARTLARKHGVDVPITEEVCAVIHEGKDPRAAVRELMMRDAKPERG